MRKRSSGAIALGLIALVASWAFGSTPLAVVGLGLAAAGFLPGSGRARRTGRSNSSARLLAGERIEGDDLAVESGRGTADGSWWHDPPPATSRPAEQTARMQRSRTVIIFCRSPGGRHRRRPSTSCSSIRSGSARIEQQVDEASSSSFAPRIPVLTSIFSAYGAREAGAARSRFAGRRASRSTPSATTRPANRCGPCTGRAPRGGAG